MKRNIFIALAATMVLGLAVAVYALNTTSTVDTSAAVSCCCCSGDSCPIRDKTVANKSVAADKHQGCCCNGDAASCPMMKDGKMAADGEHSCPMMKAGADHKMSADSKHSDMKMEGKESCPMMKGDADHKTAGTKHEMKTSDGKSHSCACCAHKTPTDK